MDRLLVIMGESRSGANNRSLFSMLGKMSLRPRLAHSYSQKSSGEVVSAVYQKMRRTHIERNFALTLDIIQESIHCG